jgi:rare lipoprotein A
MTNPISTVWIVAPIVAVFAIEPAAAAQTGVASWYRPSSGMKTANGEKFNAKEKTCAHRSVDFGAHVKVTDLKTGRSIVCRVNDRGPFERGRIVDLNPASAHALGIEGTARVRIEKIR